MQFSDKQASVLFELDRRLAIADYGDDHQPIQQYNKLKTELQLNLSLEPQVIVSSKILILSLFSDSKEQNNYLYNLTGYSVE